MSMCLIEVWFVCGRVSQMVDEDEGVVVLMVGCFAGRKVVAL